MKNNGFEQFMLVQIYNFIGEKFDSEKKADFEETQEFFKAFNLDGVNGEMFFYENKIYGNFGNVRHIDLLGAPPFRDKDNFIQWAYKKLNS